MKAATGDQYTITSGSTSATVTQLAAALREFTVDGVHLAETYPETALPPSGCGIVLAPWPNRVADGRWRLDGVEQQLDITEPARGNALHGLLRFTGYRLIEHAADSVELGATIFPQHGYPFRVETTVRYTVTDGALHVTHGARNDGDARAPIAFGTHPFLTIGDADPDELVLTVHADTRFDVDDRLNPLAEVAVDGDYDLRQGRLVRELQLDTAFGGVHTIDGVSASLTAPDGRAVHLVQDSAHGYVQVYTTTTFPKRSGGAGLRDGEPGLAVAVEPMTAPPDALNSGEGLKWLEAGETWSVGWGIRYSGS